MHDFASLLTPPGTFIDCFRLGTGIWLAENVHAIIQNTSTYNMATHGIVN